MRPALRSSSLLFALALAVAACGGRAGALGDGTDDAGPAVLGISCAFDTDCGPPSYVCDLVSLTCVQGCGLNPNCPPGKVCNDATGRCILATATDGGTDGGETDGGDAGVDGTPSDTLCKTCTVN